MIYVQRNAAGAVTAVSDHQSSAGLSGASDWEVASAEDASVQAFLTQLGSGAAASANPLVGTDLAMARVLEDLINLLIDKSVIRFTDLPDGAQAKLLARQNTRASMSRLRLMDDGDLESREII